MGPPTGGEGVNERIRRGPCSSNNDGRGKKWPQLQSHPTSFPSHLNPRPMPSLHGHALPARRHDVPCGGERRRQGWVYYDYKENEGGETHDSHGSVGFPFNPSFFPPVNRLSGQSLLPSFALITVSKAPSHCFGIGSVSAPIFFPHSARRGKREYFFSREKVAVSWFVCLYLLLHLLFFFFFFFPLLSANRERRRENQGEVERMRPATAATSFNEPLLRACRRLWASAFNESGPLR